MKGWQFWTLAALLGGLIILVLVDIAIRSGTTFTADIWGTVADWTLGIVFGVATLVFAGLAWFWSRRAALATEDQAGTAARQHQMTAVAQPVQFQVYFDRLFVNVDSPTEGFLFVMIQLSEDSIPVWLRQVHIETDSVQEEGEDHSPWWAEIASLYPPGGTTLYMSPGTVQDRMWTVSQINGKFPTEVEKYSAGKVFYSLAADTPESEWLRRDVHADWPNAEFGPVVVAPHDPEQD